MVIQEEWSVKNHGSHKREDLLIKEGMIIKDEEGHLIVKVKIDEQNYFFKKYRIKNVIHGLSRLFKKTRAYNSWIAFQLADCCRLTCY
ncbi:MAG: hypothetical protein CM15mP34_0690 [Gammaproteobacteria bacterium]|nr:MAG: hypothetical protein CM15mP34_0690 [Gammaproteobacteria bacterium]